MPDEPKPETDKKKPEGWNIRPFDKDLRIACQTQAIKEDMYDYAWVQKELRKALGLPVNSDVLDSTHERGQRTIDTVLRRILQKPPQKTSEIKAEKKENEKATKPSRKSAH